MLARGDGAEEARDAAVLRDYFNLDTGLAALSDDWAARDGRYAAIRDYIAGAVGAGPGQAPRPVGAMTALCGVRLSVPHGRSSTFHREDRRESIISQRTVSPVYDVASA